MGNCIMSLHTHKFRMYTKEVYLDGEGDISEEKKTFDCSSKVNNNF